jgi:hypothetical protein
MGARLPAKMYFLPWNIDAHDDCSSYAPTVDENIY